jgi:hypothetical protein
MLAFETPAYGELVIHAPPLNIFCVLLLPFVVSPKLMERASQYFSKMMYWIENVLFILCFIGFELMIYPFVWLKSLANVMIVSTDLPFLYVIKHTILFIIYGWFHQLYMIFRDIYILI